MVPASVRGGGKDSLVILSVVPMIALDVVTVCKASVFASHLFTVRTAQTWSVPGTAQAMVSATASVVYAHAMRAGRRRTVH